MAKYKDGQGNNSRGHGGPSFCGCGSSTRVRVFDRDQNNFRKYTHCNQINHTIDQYWELHGKPSWSPRAAYLSSTAGLSTAHDSNTL